MDRNNRMRKQIKAQVEHKKQKEANVAYMDKLKKARAKTEYISALVKGRYFLARCNMMAEQLQSNQIFEMVDNCPKTEEYLRAEYALTKVQAINVMRQVHFQKEDMVKDFEMVEEEFIALEKDYYDGKIIRESYADEHRKKDKARFVEEFKKEQS